MIQPINHSSPGALLFPEYNELFHLISAETKDLSDKNLDFTSPKWDWASWSIRQQLSHMASLIYRWLILRWGKHLFPKNDHGVSDVNGMANLENRRMDEILYWDLGTIHEKLQIGIDLIQRILSERTVGFLKDNTYCMDWNPQWTLMVQAHPTGITRSAKSCKAIMTLESSIRHIYFEEITHLYNIQRLKRAQALEIFSHLPRVGYWVVKGWDISEP